MNEVSPFTSRNLIFGPWPLLEGQLAACLRPFRPCCWLSGCHVMGMLHGKHMWPTLGRRAQQNGSTFKQKKNFVQMFKGFQSHVRSLCAPWAVYRLAMMLKQPQDPRLFWIGNRLPSPSMMDIVDTCKSSIWNQTLLQAVAGRIQVEPLENTGLGTVKS